MKKKLFLFTGIILITVLSSAVLARNEERYVYITSNNDGDFYVDKIALRDSVSLNSSPLEVWVKIVGSEMFMRNLVRQYPKLCYYSGWYVLQRIQFDVSQFKLLSYFIYSDSGELLVSYQFPSPQWQDMSPVSVPGIIVHKIIDQLNRDNNQSGENGNRQ